MAAAEIQGFEANAEHYLVVKEWIPTMGDGFDNKGGEIRSSPKKKKINQKNKGDPLHGYNFTKLWELCGCDFLFLPGFLLEVGEI